MNIHSYNRRYACDRILCENAYTQWKEGKINEESYRSRLEWGGVKSGLIHTLYSPLHIHGLYSTVNNIHTIVQSSGELVSSVSMCTRTAARMQKYFAVSIMYMVLPLNYYFIHCNVNLFILFAMAIQIIIVINTFNVRL